MSWYTDDKWNAVIELKKIYMKILQINKKLYIFLEGKKQLRVDALKFVGICSFWKQIC